MDEPKLFTVTRKSDESGVSGTGRILDGVVFHNEVQIRSNPLSFKTI